MKKIILLFLIVFVSCKKTTNNSLHQVNANNITQKKDNSLKLNKVIITGTSDDKFGFQYLNILTDRNLMIENYKDVTKEIINDSLYVVINSMYKPLFAEVTISGNNPVFFRGRVFLVPGDTISIKVKDGKVKFRGKNAVYNNFYTELDKSTPEYNRNPYQGNLMEYKKFVKSIYDKRLHFFQDYIEKYKIESKLFVSTITINLRHEYLQNLINPANVKAEFTKGLYFNESDVLYSLFYKEQDKNPEVIVDLNDYFGNITLNEFKNSEAFENSIFFRMNINEYIRYYFLDSKYIPFSKEKFLAEKEFIDTNFNGDIKNFAISEMLRDFHNRGFGKSKQTIQLLRDVIDEYTLKFIEPRSLDIVKKIKEDLDRYNFELSKSAINSQFININGDTLSLKEVFNRSNKRIKVVDFWASWCPPCIKQINEGKEFKNRLTIENNVEWIYISPEKDYQKWVNANKKLSHALNFNNSFFLLNGRKSSLSKFFKINEIPRYIIFDQQNTIILNNAPSSSDEEIFEKIIDEIYDRKKEKTSRSNS